ncbi:hypothetical protein CPB85DRAFT_1343544 [Mucidula mucida]|nr:hypothetical protein CPB85DRAFT_1343544 [Mucidula mucida]
MEQRKQKFLAKAAAKMREQGVTEAGTGVDGQEPGEMAPSKTKKAQSTSKMNRKAYDEADYPGGDVKPSPSDRTTRNRAQLPNLTPGSEDASDDWH